MKLRHKSALADVAIPNETKFRHISSRASNAQKGTRKQKTIQMTRVALSLLAEHGHDMDVLKRAIQKKLAESRTGDREINHNDVGLLMEILRRLIKEL